MKTAVVGSGGWGTALALRLTENGHDTILWSHNPEKAKQMQHSRKNPMLPGVELPERLQITAQCGDLRDRALVIIACPSIHIRSICRQVAPHLAPEAILASATKGIESGTLLRMSQIIEQETGHPVVVLTGPSHAEEVARGIPTGCLAASLHQEHAEFVQDALISENFRVYTSPDIIGAELGGALKNVIALCAGVSDGLRYGDNTKAMLMTRGLTETARLGVALGAQKETFAGLAGVGDLIVTCTSMHSRNRRAGILIGQGMPPEEAMKQVGAAVEGYYAAKSAWELAEHMGVDMPIVRAAWSVLYGGASAKQAVSDLLLRERRPEMEDVGWH